MMIRRFPRRLCGKPGGRGISVAEQAPEDFCEGEGTGI
jgi:hypothetical protein